MFEKYLIIFDADGVLADTGPIHFESWVKMANEIGFKFTKEYFEQTFGEQSAPTVRRLVGPEANQEFVVKWANKKEEYYREMVKDKLEPLPGAIELIKNLKRNKFKLAVGSSGPPENVELLLTSLGVKEFFDTITTAAEVQKSKPAPDVFLISAENLSIKSENCLVVEDAPVGITAAKRAGMKCIALSTTHSSDELLDADLVAQDLAHIKVKDIVRLLKL